VKLGNRRADNSHGPQQCGRAEHDEHRPPAGVRNEDPADEGADDRTQRDSRGNDTVRGPTILRRHVPRNDLARTGESDAFTDAERQSKEDEQPQPFDETHSKRAYGPQCDSRRDQAIDAPSIAGPADCQLQGHIGPCEGRNANSEFGRSQPKLRLELRRGDRDRAPVDIIEEDRQAQHQNQPGAADCPDWIARRGRHLAAPFRPKGKLTRPAGV
jgi:hypothetical protein